MKHPRKIIFSVALASILFIAPPAYASELRLLVTPEHLVAGESATILVSLDTAYSKINVVQGSIHIPTNVFVKDIHTGGSALTLWAKAPQFFLKERELRFAGGTIGGLPTNAMVPLFSFTVKSDYAGQYALRPNGVEVFFNDGKGTREKLTSTDYIFAVASTSPIKSAPERPLLDTVAPTFVSVGVGSEESLFDGQKYVTFFATDTGSGIASYEVREGWIGAYQSAETFYVLKHQEQWMPLFVRVTDEAGNQTVTKIPSSHRFLLWAIFVTGIVGALSVFVFRIRTRIKK